MSLFASRRDFRWAYLWGVLASCLGGPALAEVEVPAKAGSEGTTPKGRPRLVLQAIEPSTPDEAFCGILKPEPVLAPPCKLPGLPCGPVSSSHIGSGAVEAIEDLNGDGRPDLVFAGRRTAPQKAGGQEIVASYGAIYLGTAEGTLRLADYHEFDPRADAAMATLLTPHTNKDPKGKAPIIRDGFDLPLTEGHSYSVARLRRWDGSTFRTLLAFCAHKTAPVQGGGEREGQNRIELVDINQDGEVEVVLSGFVPATVFRFVDGGLALIEDRELSAKYRAASPSERRVEALRREAGEVYAKGQWRRAATLLTQARGIAPKNMALVVQLAQVQIRLGMNEPTITMLRSVLPSAPMADQALLYFTLAEAYRKEDDEDEERAALLSCLDKSPAPLLRKSAEERLQALPKPPSAQPPPPQAPQSQP